MRNSAILAAIACLGLASCQPGEVPSLSSIGLNTCNLEGLGLGALGGAAVGALIGKSWTGAALGAAGGAAVGFAATDIFANELGCDDQKRLAQTTQTAATARTYHKVYFASAQTKSGDQVSGYVMPTSSWYTDPNGRQVRTVEQVLTDGNTTQRSTIQVTADDLPANPASPGGYDVPQ